MTKRDERVLNWINRGRAALSLKPLKRIPKGIRTACPIEVALGVKNRHDSCVKMTATTLYVTDPTKQTLLKNALKLKEGTHFFSTGKELVVPKYIARFTLDVDLSDNPYKGAWMSE